VRFFAKKCANPAEAALAARAGYSSPVAPQLRLFARHAQHSRLDLCASSGPVAPQLRLPVGARVPDLQGAAGRFNHDD